MQTQVASTPELDTLLELNRDYILSVQEADVQRRDRSCTSDLHDARRARRIRPLYVAFR
jgi:hypothetical protein